MMRVITVAFALLATAAQAVSPTWVEWKNGEQDRAPLKVLRYLQQPQQDANLVVISGGRDTGLVVGAQLKVIRQTLPTRDASPMWVELGKLKAIEVQDEVTIARVETESSALSRSLFPKHPGIMAGDLAVERRVTLARNQSMAPTVAVEYSELFVDPKAKPGSFELRPEGYEKLKDVAARFARMRLSMLMIEGYTDHHGRADENQVESYQRALTVRQYLVDELGFDEKRVVAIGYGEGEPADASMAPGHVEANRRIVLKAVSEPGR